MRKNCISDLREIKYLVDCHNLKTLWLKENPCAVSKNYRQYIIKHLTFLERLDNNEVTAEERQEAVQTQFNLDDENYEEEYQ